MLIKTKSNKRCIWCKKKIIAGDSVTIYPKGIIVHNNECKREILKLVEKYKKPCSDSKRKT
jgi:hypothetical protein